MNLFSWRYFSKLLSHSQTCNIFIKIFIFCGINSQKHRTANFDHKTHRRSMTNINFPSILVTVRQTILVHFVFPKKKIEKITKNGRSIDRFDCKWKYLCVTIAAPGLSSIDACRIATSDCVMPMVRIISVFFFLQFFGNCCCSSAVMFGITGHTIHTWTTTTTKCVYCSMHAHTRVSCILEQWTHCGLCLCIIYLPIYTRIRHTPKCTVH